MKIKEVKTNKIVVSLTSFPDRILCALQVVKAMLNQTVKVNKVVLCLAEEQFPGKILPDGFKKIKDSRFEIIWGEDLKPHKKYYYTMLKYPEAVVVTVDDDINYPKDLIKQLLKSYKKFPKAVSCLRAHTVKLKNEFEFCEYREWHDFTKIINEPSLLTLPTGVGGVLYPPHIFPDILFDLNLIKNTCLMTDDLWLKWCELLNNIPCVLSDYEFELNYIENSQEQSLWKTNLNQNHNDIAWEKIINWFKKNNFEKYNTVMSSLYEEYCLRFIYPLNNYLAEVKSGNAPVNISVIMPVYNTEKYLNKAIDSVLNQTMYKLELICVDDGSTDGSVQIIRDYMEKDSRVKLVCQQNAYAGCARNNGFQHAVGDYVYFMDSDDWLEVTAFEQIYPLVEKSREDILIFFHFTNNEATGEEKRVPKYYKNNRGYKKTFLVNFKQAPEHFIYNTVVPWNKIYRRDFVKQNGFKFSPLQSANDRAFYFDTISKAENVKIYNNFLLHYRIGNDSSISSSGRLKRFDVHFKSMEEILNRCASVKEANYAMLIDVCMRDIFEYFDRAEGLLKIKIWHQMEEFFLKTDIPFSESKVSSKYFLWYKDYISIKNSMEATESIIISLTARYDNISGVYKCVMSLLMQSLHNIKVILWLPEIQFPNGLEDVPQELVELTDVNFEINFCSDYGDHCNIFPALKKYKSSIIITVNENSSYYYDMAQKLYVEYLRNRKCVCAYRCSHLFYLSNKAVFDVADTDVVSSDIMNKADIKFPVLYPVGSLDVDAINFKQDSFYFDVNYKDLWLWSMNVIAGFSTLEIERNNLKNDADLINTDVTESVNILFEMYPRLKQIVENVHLEKETKLLYLGIMQRRCLELRKELSQIRESFINDFKKLLNGKIAINSKNNPNKYKPVYELRKWIRQTQGLDIDIRHHETYTDKNQWIKLFDCNNIKAVLSDGVNQRAWLSALCGEKYLPELYKVYNSVEDIKFDELPQSYLIKCSHFNNLNIEVKGYDKLNKTEIIKKLNTLINKNYGKLVSLERQYKKIKPRIMIEELLDSSEKYRIICLNGKVELIIAYETNLKDDRCSIYNSSWVEQPFIYANLSRGSYRRRPIFLEEMIEISQKCAENFKVLCLDFCMTQNGELKIIGITFTPNSGVGGFLPSSYEYFYGDKIDICD